MLARYFELFEAPSLSDASTSARRGDIGKVADFVFAHPELIDTCPLPTIRRISKTFRLPRRVENVSILREGSGLLHNAARNGRYEVAAFLLERGASVNAMDQQHETPLHFAARWNRRTIAEFLLAKGANPNSPNKSGVTPLHYATRWGYRDVAQALLSGGAVITATRSGVTPLHWAARWGHAGIVSLLLQSGADASPQTFSGWTPLHFAARRGSAEIVELLLDAGANSTMTTRPGLSAHSRHYGWTEINKGSTAIEIAEGKNPAIARILRERSRK